MKKRDRGKKEREGRLNGLTESKTEREGEER